MGMSENRTMKKKKETIKKKGNTALWKQIHT